MLEREKIMGVLARARQMDPECQMFGASKHQYRLNLPIEASFVRSVEAEYGFSLPEDYFRFITEIGDGGAGPDYGIGSFTDFLESARSPGAERFREAYRRSLARPFAPWPMKPEDVGEYAVATKEAYAQNPGKYFIFYKEDDQLCDTDGFYTLGTHGCQWDFGLITAGPRRGQVFDTDNEGAYAFLAESFDEFYQNWLESLADEEAFLQRLEPWRKRAEKRKTSSFER